MRDVGGWFWLVALAAVVILTGRVGGEQVILKDGTVLEGAVIKQSDGYWVKTRDGRTRVIPLSEIKSVGTGGAAVSGTTASFAAAKRQADAAQSPMAATAIWQKFLDANPSPADKAAATAELEIWKKLPDDAEKINGKWVSGEERKAVLEKAGKLAHEAAELLAKNQTLAAVKKLEEAVKTYPNSYEAVMIMGIIEFQARKNTEAIRYFEQGLKLRPGASEALNNLGMAMLAKRDFARALDLVLKAVEVEDNPVLAQNLLNLVANAPPNVLGTARGKAAAEASRLLASKYRITRSDGKIALLPPKMNDRGPRGEQPDMAGIQSSGTGFVIRDDGLILTNRHVVEGATSLLVVLPGNVRKAAEVVKIDEEQDLALIRIKAESKLPVVGLAKADVPNEGAACFILGYPMIDRMGASVKITQGIISGSGRASVGTDVVIDARVNPGNSGGPLLNNHAQVIGIVTMKSRTTEREDSYGLAISAGRIRRFLGKNNITLTATDPAGQAMDAEQVAARAKGATVCVLSVR